MEAVEVVIKIPKEDYEFIYDEFADGDMPDGKSLTRTTLYAIANGTVLPKNYKKLIEAWEKVKEEIKQKSDYTKNIWDEYPDEWYAGKCSAYHESLEIIDKYLAEVSE